MKWLLKITLFTLFCMLLFVVYVMLPFTPLGFLCRSFDAETAARDHAAHDWLHSWEGNYDWTEYSNWRTIQESKMQELEPLLEIVPFTLLTEAKAVELAGQPAPTTDSGSKPYLLRAVGPFHGRIPLEVFTRENGDVWVGGGAIGSCPAPMQRRTVVVWLKQPPRHVYVTFSTAR